MLFDYSAGGLIQIADSEMKTFLVNPRIDYDTASSSARISSNKNQTSPGVARSEVLARWRKDEGAIGRAVRRGENDLLRAAIAKVKRINDST